MVSKDRGCSYRGCTVPGYLSEVHHVEPWARTHRTHIDDLTLGWTSRKHHDGTTEWIPRPTSTTDNPAPTTTGTPNAIYAKTKTTRI